MAWGFWRLPESRLQMLGDVKGRDILELGCGAARWSMALARKGARAVGVDVSSVQLGHAARLLAKSRQRVRLVRGDAEQLPFRSSSFDVVFCDWGAMTFCDPYTTVPEAARVLRGGGRFAFSTSSPFRTVAQNRATDRIGRKLLYDYFGMHRAVYRPDVNFQLPYGEWIRLFAQNGFVVESLTEPQPGSAENSPWLAPGDSAWARHWPLESIWQVRHVGRRAHEPAPESVNPNLVVRGATPGKA